MPRWVDAKQRPVRPLVRCARRATPGRRGWVGRARARERRARPRALHRKRGPGNALSAPPASRRSRAPAAGAHALLSLTPPPPPGPRAARRLPERQLLGKLNVEVLGRLHRRAHIRARPPASRAPDPPASQPIPPPETRWPARPAACPPACPPARRQPVLQHHRVKLSPVPGETPRAWHWLHLRVKALHVYGAWVGGH
jgi:hypothetical protein